MQIRSYYTLNRKYTAATSDIEQTTENCMHKVTRISIKCIQNFVRLSVVLKNVLAVNCGVNIVKRAKLSFDILSGT